MDSKNKEVSINSEQFPVIKRQENILLKKAGNTSLEIVDKIKNLTLLTGNDIVELQKSQQFILSTYTDVPEYRPLIIKLASVLNDGNFPTPDDKFWQCKKEAEVQFTQLVSELYKHERGTIDIEELDYLVASSLKSLEDPMTNSTIDPIKMKFEIKRMCLKRDEYLFNMKRLEKSIKYRIQELIDWAGIAKELEGSCKYNGNNYSNHLVESLYTNLKLKYENSISDADKKNFGTQLKTLQNIINRK